MKPKGPATALLVCVFYYQFNQCDQQQLYNYSTYSCKNQIK
jgi:hypothetical protein